MSDERDGAGDRSALVDFGISVGDIDTAAIKQAFSSAMIVVHKTAAYHPLADGTCEGCGERLLYNMAIRDGDHPDGFMHHPDGFMHHPDGRECDDPWPAFDTPSNIPAVTASR